MTKTFKNLGIVTLAVLSALVFVEVILQFTDATNYDSIDVDPGTGLLIYHPNSAFDFSSACFDNRVVINSQGFHAAPVVDPQGTKPIFRIIILGDSFMEALQVPVEKSLPYLLEQNLNSDPRRIYTYQVIPVAFSGNATYKNLLYLEKYGLAYQPDLVIDVVGNGQGVIEEANSGQAASYFQDGQVVLQAPAIPPATLSTKIKKLSRKSKLLRNLYRVGEIVMERVKEFQHPSQSSVSQPDDSIVQQGMAAEDVLFAKMAAMTKDHHARLLLLSFLPSGDPATDRLASELKAISTRVNVGYADISFQMATQQAQDGIPQVFSCDSHWNEQGHAVAAQLLSDFLKKSILIR